jgi:undecaprenyl-diphosphatase
MLAVVPFLLFALLVVGLWFVYEHLLPLVWRATRAWGRLFARLARRWSWIETRATRAETRFPLARLYLPAIVFVAAGGLLAVLAGDAFLDLAELVQSDSEALQAIDARAAEEAAHFRSATATPFFRFMTIVGTPVGLALFVAVAAFLLLRRGLWLDTIFLVAVTAGGGLLGRALKHHFERERPELADAILQARGYAFPSGHALGSLIVFGALSYLALRYLEGWRLRAFALALATGMVVAISASRLYFGVHWISDIAAGLSAATLWLGSTIAVYELLRRVRDVRRRSAG